MLLWLGIQVICWYILIKYSWKLGRELRREYESHYRDRGCIHELETVGYKGSTVPSHGFDCGIVHAQLCRYSYTRRLLTSVKTLNSTSSFFGGA